MNKEMAELTKKIALVSSLLKKEIEDSIHKSDIKKLGIDVS